MRLRRQRTLGTSSGFTLIELLVVIAIIAILAALLFPVFSIMRAKAAQGSCQGQIADIIRAAKMYKDDWRVYPDALYGISSAPTVELARGTFETRLYPSYVKDEKTFNCPNSPAKLIHTEPVRVMDRMTGAEAPGWYREFSSYDFQYRPNRDRSGLRERHYALKWSTGGSGVTDEPRQLLYRDPPDSTVVTWCLYHSNMDAAGNPAPREMAVVGFLNGRVQIFPADQVSQWNAPNYPWLISPKP